MLSASQMIHAIKGHLHVESCSKNARFLCWICAGASERGVAVTDWLNSTFVGQNRVRCPSSNHVCEACVVVMSGKPPDTERMYSHLVEGREWLKVNKGQKPAMREFLRRAHEDDWFAAIADSGQKHVIPWTPVNPPGRTGGRVLFEETLVVLPSDDRGWALLDEMTSLLTAGATKEEIASGAYGQGAYSRCAAEVSAFERSRGSERLSPWFELAVWLAQRDEQAVAVRLEEEKVARATKKEMAKPAARMRAKTKAKNGAKKDDRRSGEREITNADGGGSARDPERVPPDVGCECPEALGPDPGPAPGLGADDDGAGGVGHVDGPLAEVGQPQLALFGIASRAHARGARPKVRE